MFVGRLFPGLSQARNRAQLMAGVRDVGPPLLATAIWALVTGIATVKSGLGEWMSSFMTVSVFAGSAQLMALPLIKEMAPLWLLFAAGLVVNIRFLIFSAALQPFFRHYSWPRRMALGFFTTDVGFVLFMKRYGASRRRADPRHVWYFIGLVGPGWLVWNGFAIVGIYLAGIIPTAWSLEFAAVLALLSVVIPLVVSRPIGVCIVVAGVVAWLGQGLPLRLGLAAAVVAGILAGVASERLLRSREQA